GELVDRACLDQGVALAEVALGEGSGGERVLAGRRTDGTGDEEGGERDGRREDGAHDGSLAGEIWSFTATIVPIGCAHKPLTAGHEPSGRLPAATQWARAPVVAD